jgi:hypothetical protein
MKPMIGGTIVKIKKDSEAKMAKPGAPHEAMVETFAKRLQILYPNVVLQFGKVVKTVGLKPDIYVELSDGRKWAYEMVHGNHSAEKIIANHKRYQKAGIQDIWILWDSLRPKDGHKKPIDQGFFAYRIPTSNRYSLTKLHKAILSLQAEAEKYLYSFTVDPIGVGQETVQSGILKAMMISVDIYRFKNWEINENNAPADTYFVPVSSLEFGETGKFLIPKVENLEDSPEFDLELLGFDSSFMIVRSAIERFEQLLSTPEGLKQITDVGLLKMMPILTQEELLEIQEFAQSEEAKKIQPFSGKLSKEEGFQAIHDPKKMMMLAEDTENLLQYLEAAEIPKGIKKLVLAILGNGQDLKTISQLMELQSNSENFQNLKRLT